MNAKRSRDVWDPLIPSGQDRNRARAVPGTPQTRAPAYRLAYDDADFLCREELHLPSALRPLPPLHIESTCRCMVWYGNLLYTSRRKSHSTPRAGTRFASTRRHPRRVEGIS